MRLNIIAWCAVLIALAATSGAGAQESAARDATRARLGALLESAGQRTDVNIPFRRSTKNPYNFVGSRTTGLVNADSLEVVISVTKSDTIGFRIYPHYKGDYINLGKARDASGLMRKLLYLSDQNFCFGAATTPPTSSPATPSRSNRDSHPRPSWSSCAASEIPTSSSARCAPSSTARPRRSKDCPRWARRR